MTFFDYIRNAVFNIFIILLLIQFLPPLLYTVKNQYENYIKTRTKIGVLSVKGLIMKSEQHIIQLHELFEDDSIKGVLIKIDCAGGAESAAQAIHNELQFLKKTHPKPVIALVENIAVAGGYYIASAADHSIAPGSSIIGGIGICEPCMEQTPEIKKTFESMREDAYQQFVHDVVASRNLSMSTLTSWADGKLFSGRQALRLGLIDELGSLYTAINAIKQKGIIEGEIEWVALTPQTWLARIFGQGDDAASVLNHNLCAVLGSQSTPSVTT